MYLQYVAVVQLWTAATVIQVFISQRIMGFVEVPDFLSAAQSVYIRLAVKYLVSILTLVLIPVSETGILPAEKITV